MMKISIATVALALSLTACTGVSESGEDESSPDGPSVDNVEGTPAAADSAESDSGTEGIAEEGGGPSGSPVTIGVAALPPVIDAFTSSAPPRSYFVASIYSQLTKLEEDDDGQLKDIPLLAESWEQIDDETWEFKLKDDLTFSNGEPITADAVKFSLDYILDPDNNKEISARFARVLESEVIDELTIQFETDGFFALLPRQIGLLSIVEPTAFQEMGEDDYWADPVSSGAWLLESFNEQESISMVPNPEWSLEQPTMTRVEFLVVPEQAGRIAALRTGEVDAINFVDPSQLPLLDDGPFKVTSFVEPSTYVIDLYQEEGPLADVRVRQAISHAIDGEAILDGIMGGQGEVAQAQFIPSNLSGYCPDIESYEYDPELARELLAEAGYEPEELSLTLQSSTGFFLNDSLMAQAIQSMLVDAGISVNVEVMEFSNFLDAYYGDAPRADLFAWRPGSAPLLDVSMQMVRWTQGYTTHNIGYSNQAYDDIIDEAENLALDDPEREALYCEAVQILKDEAPVRPVIHPPGLWAISDDLSGFEISVLGIPTLDKAAHGG